jgi:hypothetical protein
VLGVGFWVLGAALSGMERKEAGELISLEREEVSKDYEAVVV